MLALFCFATSFGGWLGIILVEHENVPLLENIAYFTEHIIGAFGGPVILTIAGRFDMTEYLSINYVQGGYYWYAIYMRWFLAPISMYTWANLNHNLCGCDNDPVYVLFDLGWTYNFWAEFYSMFLTWASFLANYLICVLFKKLFFDKAEAHVKTK
jgi:hypothetical protein